MDLRMAATQFEQDSKIMGILAVCLQKVGRTEESCKCFNEAIELSPGSKELYIGRGNLYTTMGRYKEARRD